MSENGIFLYFWTKKVIFKNPPPSTYEKTNYKRKKGIFLYFGMRKKMCWRNPRENALPGLKAEAMPKKIGG